ncbi:hypothetical protein ACH5RR_003942 [Cinchona calisaya]|uniref:Uncharacterized protein n=1 Tax=Cinchona calisaya TaxID=153742 RepID=A0ABD3AW92_9GENT
MQPYRHQTTSSSGYSYFTEQALRWGYRIPDSGPLDEYFDRGFEQASKYFRNPIDAVGAIERELENERIREEIIAVEISKRQAVWEAEVKREMMINRELTLLLRGGGRGNTFYRFSCPLGGGSRFKPSEVQFHHTEGQSLEETIAKSLEARSRMAARRETRGLEMVPIQHYKGRLLEDTIAMSREERFGMAARCETRGFNGPFNGGT